MHGGMSPQRAHPSCGLRVIFLKSWFGSQPEDALTNSPTHHLLFGLDESLQGRSVSTWDLEVSKVRTYCLWSSIWLANLASWGQARSALGGSLTYSWLSKPELLERGAKDTEGAPRWIFLPILWNDLALAGKVQSLLCRLRPLGVMSQHGASHKHWQYLSDKPQHKHASRNFHTLVSCAGHLPPETGVLTVSASTKSVGHSEQEVSIWEELTNLDPIPRRLSPR